MPDERDRLVNTAALAAQRLLKRLQVTADRYGLEVK